MAKYFFYFPNYYLRCGGKKTAGQKWCCSDDPQMSKTDNADNDTVENRS